MIYSNDISLQPLCYKRALLSTDVLVKFVLTAIDSCCVIQNRLNLEEKPGCAQELVSAMAQTLTVVRALILLIIKRSEKSISQEHDSESQKEPKSNDNYRIARILFEELLNRCPKVLAPCYGYVSPVENILFKTDYKPFLLVRLFRQCYVYNCQFITMIVQSQCDLNATDSLGNTLLHNVVCDALQEIKSFRGYPNSCRTVLTEPVIKIVKILLDNGSYPHAKNKQRKCPFDELTDIELNKSNPENIIASCKELMKNYDRTLTLKYLAATKIVDSAVPYRHLLPEALVKFVDLH